MQFPHLTHDELITQFEWVSPAKYANSRNFISWAVTRLSPYITHGVITTPELIASLLARHTPYEADSLLKELTWKEYFTQVLVFQGDHILSDLEDDKTGISRTHILPESVALGNTGRVWLDTIIQKMQKTGYLHNHERMWLAAYLVHFGKLHWRRLADWSYYHFLDGDLGVNHLSWQWVSSTFSSKPYYFTSDNIEKYARVAAPELIGSYEDVWARITDPARVSPFADEASVSLEATSLLAYPRLESLSGQEVVVLTPWSLSESLVRDIKPENRYLVLDEGFFARHPMSPARIEWIVGYARQLWAQVVRGDLASLIRGFSGGELSIQTTYNPVYREAIDGSDSRASVCVLPYPSVSPKFGVKYFPRFFGYFAAINWRQI